MKRFVVLAPILVVAACGGSGGSRAQTNAPVVVRSVGPHPGIVRRDPDGTLHNLTTNSTDTAPTFSVDGSRIAFQRPYGGPSSNDAHLYVVNADGREVQEVRSVQPAAYGDVGSRLGISPDGERLAYPTNHGLRTVDVDGEGDRRVYRSHGVFTVGDSAWSPDGKTIVFTVWGKGLFTVGADGSSPRLLVPLPHNDSKWDFFTPSWSPGGKRIAFVQVNPSRFPQTPATVQLVNADGSGRQTLTEVQFPASAGSTWSPDGRSIAFSDVRKDIPGIWVVSASGGTPHLLLKGSYTTPSSGPAGA